MPVKTFAEFSDIEKERYRVFKKTLPVPFPEFDGWGLRFTTEHLNALKITVILLPLEDMAIYADVVTYQAIRDANTNFLYEQFFDMLNGHMPRFASLNTTAIGNLALVAMECHIEGIKMRAKATLANIYDWHRRNISMQNN